MNSRTHLVPFYAISAALHIAVVLVWANLLASENYVDLNINDSVRSLQITLLENNHKAESSKTTIREQKNPLSRNTQAQIDAHRNPNVLTHKNIIAIQTELANTRLAVAQPELRNATDTVVTSQAPAIQQSHAEPFLTATTTIQESGDHDESNERSAAATRGLQDQNVLIQKKLRAHLNQHFYYPRIAVQKGWQGTVELGLRVEASGKLTQLRILKTSGYSILDQAALATLQKADYIKEIETLLTGSYFDTTLPVMYQLIGG